MDVQPLNATFGAIVRGIKLASLDDETWSALHETWLEYALLIADLGFEKGSSATRR